jgi:hypothetical protein
MMCVNDRCPEYQLVKTNPFNLPIEGTICGRCGSKVQPIPEAEPEP